MSIIFVGLLGALITGIITIHHQSVKEQCLLIEKWMNNLRDEISKFLGLCNKLAINRFSGPDNEAITSNYKVKLLLNDEPDQKRLSELVDNLFYLVTKYPGIPEEESFDDIQKSVFNKTRLILDNHWKRINNDLKYLSMPHLIRELKELYTYFKSLIMKNA